MVTPKAAKAPAPEPVNDLEAAVTALDAVETANAAMTAVESYGQDLAEIREKLKDVPQGQFDGLLARLEGVEKSVAGPATDWTGMFEQVNESIAELRKRSAAPADSAAVDELRGNMAALAETVSGLADYGPVLADLAKAIDGLATRQDTAMGVLKERVDWLSQQAVGDFTNEMGEPTRVGGVYRKVHQLMAAVPALAKTGEVKPRPGEDKGPRYKFRGVDAAMNAIGTAMREVGLLMQTTVLSREYSEHVVQNGNRTTIWTTCRLHIRYTFVDFVDGSTFPVEMMGEGKDSSDKATSKAEAMALKYALFQALMIPVDDMPDSDRETPVIEREIEQPQAQPQQAPMTADERRRKAADAMQAVQGLPEVRVQGASLTLAQQRDRLDRIVAYCRELGIMNEIVDGAHLGSFLRAQHETYAAGAGEEAWRNDPGRQRADAESVIGSNAPEHVQNTAAAILDGQPVDMPEDPWGPDGNQY